MFTDAKTRNFDGWFIKQIHKGADVAETHKPNSSALTLGLCDTVIWILSRIFLGD
jgi:hypothetical protein